MRLLGWDACDIIIVTGDAYIDSPYSGAAVIGRVLLDAGYKVGIIAQPDINLKLKTENLKFKTEEQKQTSHIDIARLGEPRLFWGVTSGCVDSMVSNFTAVKKPRRSDDFTPGGKNTKRPNRAVIAYSNHIRFHFKGTKPIVLGGIEASLRRMAHYDYWDNGLRRSILFDAKADYLVYGMGERAVLELAEALDKGGDAGRIRGICHISAKKPGECVELPSFDECAGDKEKFTESFRLFYNNNDAQTAKPLAQRQDTRYLVQNRPSEPLTEKELDRVYELDYEYDAHPYYKKMGVIKALDTIKFSITSHRGCYGECNFCAITTHQGRVVSSRSEGSILREAGRLVKLKGFTGNIYDVGGPTANMYKTGCSKIKGGHCANKRCLYPGTCPSLINSHEAQIELLDKIREIKGVKRVFIASGIRHDMVMADKRYGPGYMEKLVSHYTSGQLKLAPEHSQPAVLSLMGKPDAGSTAKFRERFYLINREKGMKQFLSYYLIAAHPGCDDGDMRKLKEYLRAELKANPQQVQIFTPAPGTWSGVMYYTEKDPFTGRKIFVEKGQKGKERQKHILKPA